MLSVCCVCRNYVELIKRTLCCHSPRGGGGGGTLIFSAYVGSDPASTVHPKTIHPKKYLKF